jgi:hypothetical protein
MLIIEYIYSPFLLRKCSNVALHIKANHIRQASSSVETCTKCALGTLTLTAQCKSGFASCLKAGLYEVAQYLNNAQQRQREKEKGSSRTFIISYCSFIESGAGTD